MVPFDGIAKEFCVKWLGAVQKAIHKFKNITFHMDNDFSEKTRKHNPVLSIWRSLLWCLPPGAHCAFCCEDLVVGVLALWVAIGGSGSLSWVIMVHSIR